jgi:hypothetical protein
MITFEDARRIVHGSVGKKTGRSSLQIEDTLLNLGIGSRTDLQDLIETIVHDPEVGTSALFTEVESNQFVNLALSATVLALVNTLQLSARKLCSNPTSPHEQPCCPYPKECGECGYKVL